MTAQVEKQGERWEEIRERGIEGEEWEKADKSDADKQQI